MTNYPIPERATLRYGRHRVARPTVAAEGRGSYDPAGRSGGVGAEERVGGSDGGGADDHAGGRDTADGRHEPPFGLPVLASVPDLAAALEAIDGAERRMLEAVVTISRLLDSDEVAQATGVPVEHWLAIVCRQTRMDRRLLLRLARLIDRYPSVRGAVEAGRVSFAQLRGLGMVLRQAPAGIDVALDALLVRLLVELEGADPDVLVDQVRQAIVELAADESLAERTGVSNSLWLQPNLLATGGRFGGELDAAGLAILDAATAPTREQLHHPDSTAGARADNLLTRLLDHGDSRPAAGGTGGDRHAGAPDAADGGGAAADTVHAGGDPGGQGAGCAGAPGAGGRAVPLGVQAGGLLPPVKLLVRVQLETLGSLPADLLTQLTGGHLKLSSAAARWLLDRRGVDLRLVVVDQGEVVGVGRQSRQAPGWLADAVLAVHDTCTAPLCDRPARGADLDHATPWWPARSDEAYGTTDIANVGPLCDATNRDKEKAGWQAVQTGDGRRTWTHPRTGLSITTIPSTWRPAGWKPPGTDPPDGNGQPGGSRPPDGNGPPGGDRSPGSATPQPPPDPDDVPF